MDARINRNVEYSNGVGIEFKGQNEILTHFFEFFLSSNDFIRIHKIMASEGATP